MTEVINLRPKKEAPKIYRPPKAIIEEPLVKIVNNKSGKSIACWIVPSPSHSPQKRFIVNTILILIGIGFFLFLHNTLVAIVIILSGLIISFIAPRSQDDMKITVNETGVYINGEGYHYRNIRSFWIDSVPDSIQEISLELDHWYSPYLRIPLGQADPLEIRNLMIEFVTEEKHELSFMDILSRYIGV